MIMRLGIQITNMMSWTGVAQLQHVLGACYHLIAALWPQGKMSSADAHPLPITVVGLFQAPGEPDNIHSDKYLQKKKIRNSLGKDLKIFFFLGLMQRLCTKGISHPNPSFYTIL